MPDITIVTGNTTKFVEMTEALSHFDISTQRLDLDLVEAQSLDGAMVTRDKVQKAFAAAGRPVIVDDAGMYFAQYQNFPGTYSKFLYKAIGFPGIFRLVQPGDRAVFIAYVGYLDAALEEPLLFHGEYAGRIVDDFDHTQDYEMPYAPMFVPDGSTIRMSEMTPLQRAGDHRHQALGAFAEWFANRS